MANFVAVGIAAGAIQPHRPNRRARNARREAYLTEEELHSAIRLSDVQVFNLIVM